MTAISNISEPQRGQNKGSTSSTLARSRAEMERQAAYDTVVGSVMLTCADIGSM
jgi:hypothetical protein